MRWRLVVLVLALVIILVKQTWTAVFVAWAAALIAAFLPDGFFPRD